MTLATHIVIAAAITKPLASFHPAIAFFVALASHYVADAIPHWDYNIRSAQRTSYEPAGVVWNVRLRPFLLDLLSFAVDALSGAAIALFFLWPDTPQEFIMAGVTIIGAALPDFLQGLFYAAKMKFLRPFQIIHDLMHTQIRLHPYPLLGIPFQALFFLGAVYFLL